MYCICRSTAGCSLDSHTHIISSSSASCFILFPFSIWRDMKVLQHDLNYTKFRSISTRVSVCKRTQVPFVNPIVWPYLTRDSARQCECKPVLADSLLFSWRQIRGSKIDSCNSGIIQLTTRRIILLSLSLFLVLPSFHFFPSFAYS